MVLSFYKFFVPHTERLGNLTYESQGTIVGVAPFYNQTAFSITECYLTCLRESDKCYFVEVANLNEAWSCKLFHFIQDITKCLKPNERKCNISGTKQDSTRLCGVEKLRS